MPNLIEEERAYFAAEFGPQTDARTGETLPGHRMTVIHDETPFRHVRFARPHTGIWSFSLVTWPGHLAISGDLDDYVFARSFDMVEFFRADAPYHLGINPGYWAEKVVAASIHSPVREFSVDRFKQIVRELGTETVDGADLSGGQRERFWAQVDEDLFANDEDELDDSEAHRRLGRFVFDYDGRSLRFHDTWEWDFQDFSRGFLRSCWAIRFGIDMYLAQPGSATLREIAT
jgi:hypothetical protein